MGPNVSLIQFSQIFSHSEVSLPGSGKPINQYNGFDFKILIRSHFFF